MIDENDYRKGNFCVCIDYDRRKHDLYQVSSTENSAILTMKIMWEAFAKKGQNLNGNVPK